MFNNAMLTGFELYPRWVPLIREREKRRLKTLRVLLITTNALFGRNNVQWTRHSRRLH